MAERIPLSKKIRFEVFKRDSFTCQYCGRMAPDVILEVDHIKPVSKGGTNDIMNLVTSCRGCNRGKRDIELTDNSTIKKQQAQIKELAEKNEQLEMMLEWRSGLEQINKKTQSAILDYMMRQMNISHVRNIHGIVDKLASEFSLNDIFDAIDTAVRQYYETEEDAEYTVNKISGICNNKVNGQSKQKYYFNYLRKACKNKFVYWNETRLAQAIFTSPNRIDNDEKFEQAKSFLNASYSWSMFIEQVEQFVSGS